MGPAELRHRGQPGRGAPTQAPLRFHRFCDSAPPRSPGPGPAPPYSPPAPPRAAPPEVLLRDPGSRKWRARATSRLSSARVARVLVCWLSMLCEFEPKGEAWGSDIQTTSLLQWRSSFHQTFIDVCGKSLNVMPGPELDTCNSEGRQTSTFL